jgi:hypothetical protein
MKEARLVFKRGRTSPVITYHLFIASALMEWHLNKDVNVARNIFELGMTRFGTDPDYVAEYIKFLQHLNEENNILLNFHFQLENIFILTYSNIYEYYLRKQLDRYPRNNAEKHGIYISNLNVITEISILFKKLRLENPDYIPKLNHLEY